MKITRSPVLAILLVAPFVGEVMSTATPPLDALLPWKLPLLVALYGCGALLCRELVVRYRLGLPGLFLLAAAYAVYEEALIVSSWFDPEYHDKVGIGSYSVVWHTNLMIATHLIAFHVAVSIGSSVLLVERLHPERKDQPWVGRRGLVIAAVAFLGVVPLGYETAFDGPTGPVIAAACLAVVLAAAGFVISSPAMALRRGLRPPPATAPRRGRQRPRVVALVAFLAAGTHFVLVYALPSTGIPWPAGVPLALAPIAVGALVIRRLNPDGLKVVTGILGFFVGLDLVIGLGGRFDFIGGALLATYGLWRLNKRTARPSQPAAQS